MPRNRKPRKRYRPGALRLDAHLYAVDRIATLLPEQRQRLAGPTAAAVDAFRLGRGGPNHWLNLADAFNVGEALAKAHIGGEPLVPIFAAAKAALASVHARQQLRDSWTLRAAELQALDDAAHWHTWQLDLASQGELQDAVQRVKRRSAGALAGNVGAGTTVCVGGLGRRDEAAS